MITPQRKRFCTVLKPTRSMCWQEKLLKKLIVWTRNSRTKKLRLFLDLKRELNSSSLILELVYLDCTSARSQEAGGLPFLMFCYEIFVIIFKLRSCLISKIFNNIKMAGIQKFINVSEKVMIVAAVLAYIPTTVLVYFPTLHEFPSAQISSY